MHELGIQVRSIETDAERNFAHLFCESVKDLQGEPQNSTLLGWAERILKRFLKVETVERREWEE